MMEDSKHIEDDVAYYYDFHPTEEDLMGETSVHAALVHYLMDVLTWLFRGQVCAIYENLNFYQTSNPNEYPLAPDIAVLKEVDFSHLRSWKVGKSGPALRHSTGQRLYGWHLSRNTGKPQMQAMPVGPQGRLWSPHLDSFLVPEGELLRLYDRQGHLRLTQTEVLAEKLRSLGIDPDNI